MPPPLLSRPPATSIISRPKTSPPFTPMLSAGRFARFTASAIRRLAGQESGDHRSGDLRQGGEEFVDLPGFGVRDEDDVLVANSEFPGERVGFGIAEIEAVDDRRDAFGRP